MNKAKLFRWMEPIGLALLLFSFGWQCVEESIAQLKNDVFLREMDEKIGEIQFITSMVLLEQEGVHKDVASEYYDFLGSGIKEKIRLYTDQIRVDSVRTELIQRIRIIFYILGSVLVLVPKVRTAITGKEE